MADPVFPDPFAPEPEPPPDPVRQPAAPPLRGWQAAGATPKRSSTTTALVVTILLFTLVAGVLVAVLRIPERPKSTFLVSVPICGYKGEKLSPVAWAERDTLLMCELLPANANGNAFSAQQSEKLAGLLASIRKGEGLDPAQPFLLHVAALTVVEGDSIYVLPADADSTQSELRVNVEEILQAMQECPAKSKLLVLDFGRPTGNAFVGPLSDDAPAKLHELLSNRATLPCPVFTACGKNERSLDIPEVRQSAFAWYFAAGLRGAADGYRSGRPDLGERGTGGISMRELTNFVTARVSRWAKLNRGASQTPRLYDNGFREDDFPILLDPRGTDARELAKFNPPPDGLRAEWDRRDKLPAAWRRQNAAPLARWEAALIRAEQVYEATELPGDLAASLGYAPPRELKSPAAPPRHASLRNSGEVPAEARKAIEDVLAAAAPDEPKPAVEGVRPPAPKPQGPPLAIARLTFDWLRDKHPTPSEKVIEFANGQIADALRGRPELYEEALALRRLAAIPSSSVLRNSSSSGYRGDFLTAEAAAAESLSREPAGFAWVRDLADDADQTKARAEEKLFAAERSADLPAAAAELRAAAAKFQELNARLLAMTEARTAATEALAVAGATAATVAESDVLALAEWEAFIVVAASLADRVFQKPDATGTWNPTEFANLAKQVAQQTLALRKPFATADVDATIKQANAWKGTDLALLRGRLMCPLLVADDRRKLWEAYSATSLRLFDDTRKNRDDADDGSSTRTQVEAATPPDPADLRRRRAVVSVLLLRLAGMKDTERLLRDARTGAPELGDELRTRWTTTLPATTLAFAADGQFEQAERALRVFPVGLWVRPAGAASEFRPLLEARLRDDSAWRDWLREHYGRYGKLRRTVSGAEASYRKASEEAAPGAPN